MAADLAREQIPGNDARCPVVDRHHVHHLHLGPQLHAAEADLAGELLVGAEEELLTGLAAGVERTRHLRPAERAVVEQAAVLPGERNALGDHLVDDVDRHLGEAVHVRLTGAEVAALHGVVEQPVNAVAVTLVVLGCVDAALCRDRVRPARRVVECERLHLVAEFRERGRSRCSGEARPDDQHLELALVVRVDELQVFLVPEPLVLDGTLRDLRREALGLEGRPIAHE